jgi:hypothetical protein
VLRARAFGEGNEGKADSKTGAITAQPDRSRARFHRIVLKIEHPVPAAYLYPRRCSAQIGGVGASHPSLDH